MDPIDTTAPLLSQTDRIDRAGTDQTQPTPLQGSQYINNIAALTNDRERDALQWRDTRNPPLLHTPRVTSQNIVDGSLVGNLGTDDDMPHYSHHAYQHDDEAKIINVYNDTTNTQINNAAKEPTTQILHNHQNHPHAQEPSYEYHHHAHYVAPVDKAYYAAAVTGPSETELADKQNMQYQQLMLIYIAVAAVALFALMSRAKRPPPNH